MRRVQLLFAVLGTAVAGLAAPAADAAELPAGANSALVAKRCAACHDLQPLFDAAGVSRDDWNGALDEMVGYGLKVTPEERAADSRIPRDLSRTFRQGGEIARRLILPWQPTS